jgi:hypothetical protein
LPFLGVWDSALAAADLAALLDFGLLRTLEAAEAAFEPVWRLFLATVITSFPRRDDRVGKLGSLDQDEAAALGLQEIVAELPLDAVHHVVRVGEATPAATSGGVTGWSARCTAELRRDTPADGVAKVVLAALSANESDVAAAVVVRHRALLM